MAKKHNVSLYRALHRLRKGGLHKSLGIEEGTKIPHKKIVAATKSSNPHIAKQAQFALTMSKFKH